MDTPLFPGLEFKLKKFFEGINFGTLPPAWIITENNNAVHVNICWSKPSQRRLEDSPKAAVTLKPRKNKSPATRRRDKSRLQKWLSSNKLKSTTIISSPEQDADVQTDEAPENPSEVLVRAPAFEKAGEHVDNSNSEDEGRPPALNRAGEHTDASSSIPTATTPPASDIPESSSTISDSPVSTASTTCSASTPSNDPSTTSAQDSSVTTDHANDDIDRKQPPEPIRRSRRLQGRPAVAEEMLADFSRSHLLLAQMLANQSA